MSNNFKVKHGLEVANGITVDAGGLNVTGVAALDSITLVTPLPAIYGGSGSANSTGTGDNVLNTSPTLVTPILGAASATSLNKVIISQPASVATLTLAEGSSLITSGANSLTLTTSANTNVTLPVSGTLLTDAVTTLSSLSTVGTVTAGTWSSSFGAVSASTLTNLTAANLEGTIPSTVLANSSVYIGTTQIALNRASGPIALAGVSVDSAGGLTTATGVVSVSAATAPSQGHVLTAIDGTSAQWSAPATADLSTATGVLPVLHGGTGVAASTGTVKAVLSTSPTLSTSVLTDSTSFDLLNTTATTVNFAGAATTLNVGSGTGTTTINNDLVVGGNITFNGGATEISTTVLSVADPLIYMAENNPADSVDIGLFAGYTVTGAHYHTGVFRDATDKVWKLFSGIANEPVGNVLDLTGATYDDLKIGKLSTTGVNKVVITEPQDAATLTLANNSSLITSGAFSTTLTATATTALTLPTSGTLLSDSASINIGTTSVPLNRASGALTVAGLNIDGYASALKNATGSVVVSAAAAPTNGQVLMATGTSTATWQSLPSGSSGTVTSVAALTLGTTGTDVSSSVATNTTTPVITLNIPTASATNRGALSSTDWSTFNGKQAAITFGTGVLTWIGTPSSANLATAMSDKTGSGDLVFATSPTLVTPVLGTPTSGDLSNCTNAVGYGLKSATTTVSISASTAPTSGMVLTATSGTTATWQTPTAGGSGTVTSVAALTIGTTGTDVTSTVATGTTTPVITLNIPTASASNRGVLSSTDWSTFNSKVGLATVNTVANTISDGLGNLRSIPQDNKTAAYTLVAADNGKNINITTGGITIPSGVFLAGDVVSVYNQSGTAQNISWSGPTVYVSGTSTAKTSPASLAARGILTIMFATATEIVMSGNV